MTAVPPVALVTYSTKPRGGVVHTLALGEALHRLGHDVRVVALGDPEAGFFRAVEVPATVVPAPAAEGSLEEKVERNTQALAESLCRIGPSYPVLHAQDCIAARAVTRARQGGLRSVSVRTVHHVDDFCSAVLMDCQRQAILEPDVVLTVSEHWRVLLAADYGVKARVVRNGVDAGRFSRVPPDVAEGMRQRWGVRGHLVLSVGGIEPRKGSAQLVRALSLLADRLPSRPVLAVLGGHSFQDHRAYRQSVLDDLPGLGLEIGRDVLELGMVPDADVPIWYAAADVLAFPSTKEGFGLAVIEAMSAGLPVVTTDLPVFREYLTPGVDALMVPVGNPEALAAALERAISDEGVRATLRAGGRGVAARFTWEASARDHAQLYARLACEPR